MDIQQMMQQAKAMQDKMQEMQERLADEEVEGTSGGGVVTAVMSCKGECKKITIHESLMDYNEKDVLEDLVKAAINDAKSKSDQKLADETKKMMESLGIPPGVELPL